QIGYQGMDASPMLPLDGKYTRDMSYNPFGADKPQKDCSG
ncbi:hypothetical protein EZS27_043117, partial [termite gut metagenome]